MENINIGDWVEVTETTKLDEAKGFRVGSSYKVIGKDTREGILIVKTIIGYLSILASKVEKISVSNEKIEAGDWVEVLEILEEDSNIDIDKGYVTQVMGVLSDDGVEIRTKEGDTWWLHTFQIKRIDIPKPESVAKNIKPKLYTKKPVQNVKKRRVFDFMKNGTVKNLGELELRELVDLGLRMPDGSKEFFEVVDKRNDCITVMTKNIIDFMPFNARENKHSGKVNSYAESSIRSYLAELYQSVAKENAELDEYNYDSKGFFLPTATALGFGDEAEKGWQAFKDDASRVKYPGTYASTKDEAYGLGESDWYWTGTSSATSADYVRSVSSGGTLGNSGAYYGNSGATPALNLKAFAPVILIDGVWSLYDCISDTSNDESVDIKIGDWVEVTHTAEIGAQEGILLGDCFEVAGFGAQGEVNITLSSGKSWYLSTDQIRKIKSPLFYHEKTKESVEHNERLKGYYQHTAIETLKLYHTAHKVKEERVKALNKALENIQELIKLEKKND